jgi:hypothetical protein
MPCGRAPKLEVRWGEVREARFEVACVRSAEGRTSTIGYWPAVLQVKGTPAEDWRANTPMYSPYRRLPAKEKKKLLLSPARRAEETEYLAAGLEVIAAERSSRKARHRKRIAGRRVRETIFMSQ